MATQGMQGIKVRKESWCKDHMEHVIWLANIVSGINFEQKSMVL